MPVKTNSETLVIINQHKECKNEQISTSNSCKCFNWLRCNWRKLQGNVYKAGQVNAAQAARTIKITAVLPAKIEVDNSQQKQQAQVGGAIVGALAGGLAGGFGGIGSLGTAGTTVGGGAIGAAAGSMVSDKVLVDGVSIAYIENERMFTSAQVGKVCEFRVGATALIISTTQNETRIQPNNTCPVQN